MLQVELAGEALHAPLLPTTRRGVLWHVGVKRPGVSGGACPWGLGHGKIIVGEVAWPAPALQDFSAR